MTRKDNAVLADCVSIDGENGILEKLSEDTLLLSDAAREERENAEQLREDLQLLTENEKRALYMAYGIGCKRYANAGKIAKALGIRELEVKRALQSGKRKLEELANGRK